MYRYPVWGEARRLAKRCHSRGRVRRRVSRGMKVWAESGSRITPSTSAPLVRAAVPVVKAWRLTINCVGSSVGGSTTVVLFFTIRLW